MKHSKKLIRSLLGLIVLLASCQVDDSPSILSDSEAQLFVSEARDYYEQTISEAVEKYKLVQNKNMSPGEVTPCWHKAHIKQDANYEYVYVPIIAGNNYIRRVKIGKQGEKKNYRIPISQTLCVRRDKMSNYDAAYVTIMPSLNYYRANKSTFSEKVIQDRSLYGNLSGYVVYNNIVTSKMIVADRVKSGKCLWSYSPTTLKDKALSRKIKKEIFQNIHNIGMSLTRNTIDGGMLEEVEITPEKCPICGENDSDDHYCPTEESPGEEEEEEEGDDYFPGGWGGGGGAPSGGGSSPIPPSPNPAYCIKAQDKLNSPSYNNFIQHLAKCLKDYPNREVALFYKYDSSTGQYIATRIYIGNENETNIGVDPNMVKQNTGYIHSHYDVGESTMPIFSPNDLLFTGLLYNNNAIYSASNFSTGLYTNEGIFFLEVTDKQSYNNFYNRYSDKKGEEALNTVYNLYNIQIHTEISTAIENFAGLLNSTQSGLTLIYKLHGDDSMYYTSNGVINKCN